MASLFQALANPTTTPLLGQAPNSHLHYRRIPQLWPTSSSKLGLPPSSLHSRHLPSAPYSKLPLSTPLPSHRALLSSSTTPATTSPIPQPSTSLLATTFLHQATPQAVGHHNLLLGRPSPSTPSSRPIPPPLPRRLLLELIHKPEPPPSAPPRLGHLLPSWPTCILHHRALQLPSLLLTTCNFGCHQAPLPSSSPPGYLLPSRPPSILLHNSLDSTHPFRRAGTIELLLLQSRAPTASSAFDPPS